MVGDGDPARDVVLIDEVLTPDSSRFWPRAEYEPGHGQPSFDKQFVRDYLEQIRWNKQPPVPSLPDDVVRRTHEQVRRGVPAPVRPRTAVAAVRDQLEKLVQEMLEEGVLYDDARREFEKVFLTRALQRAKGSVGDTAELLGLHRNTVAPAHWFLRHGDPRVSAAMRPASKESSISSHRDERQVGVDDQHGCGPSNRAIAFTST